MKKVLVPVLIIILIVGITGIYILNKNGLFFINMNQKNGNIIPGSNIASNTTSNNDSDDTLQDTNRDITTGEEIKEAPSKRISITASGDILLGRGVEYYLKSAGLSYTYPFEEISEILKRGDIIFGNLEEPFTSSVHGLINIDKGGKYVLKNEVEAFEGIKYAGFNLLNLANNHILDFYAEGLQETISLLESEGIVYAGAGMNIDEARKPGIIEKNNVKVGMLAYTDMSEVVYIGEPNLYFKAEENKPGVAPRYEDYNIIKEDIDKIRDQVDLLIISLHWGIEESFIVTNEQKQYAYNLLDAGADIILGHHPHQFQGIEIYKGKPIVYSLGNLIFDQNDPENQEAFILYMEYEDGKLVKFTGTPVRTINKTQVVPQKGDSALNILQRQIDLCAELGTHCYIEDDQLVFSLD